MLYDTFAELDRELGRLGGLLPSVVPRVRGGIHVPARRTKARAA